MIVLPPLGNDFEVHPHMLPPSLFKVLLAKYQIIPTYEYQSQLQCKTDGTAFYKKPCYSKNFLLVVNTEAVL
jgi:hypothetical protein